jgi:hypothetical protein
MAQIHKTSKKKSKSPDFYDDYSAGSQEYKKDSGFFLLSYLVCSQIWLIILWMITTSAISQNWQKKKKKNPSC